MAQTSTGSRPLHGSRPARLGRRGMTLMELMVSVALLAGMILAFNIILSQSQRVVSGAQRAIRANASGMAIAQVIRRDMRSISKDGFLYIGQDVDASRIVANAAGSPKRPLLLFTAAGLSESVTGNARGTGTLVCYRCATKKIKDTSGAIVDDLTEEIFCRIGLVLSTDASTSLPWPNGDRWDNDLADIQRMSDADIRSGIADSLDDPIALIVPPLSAGDITSLWKVLTHNVQVTGTAAPYSTHLKIEYSLPGELGTWTPPSPGGDIWTFRNQDAWPVAIKFRFTMSTASQVRRALRDPNAPDSAVDYEVVCPIGN